MSGLPILIEGSRLRALVVGGGEVAARKAAALSDAGARVRVIAVAAGSAVRAMAAEGRVALEERCYAAGDVADAQLVVAATSDRAVNAAVAAEGAAAGRLVNVADAPDEGTFATMATHRSGALVVGVSAGGVPGAAARIRDAIAARFDARYAAALGELGAIRRRLLDRGDGPRWRTLSRAVIGPAFCDSVEQGSLDEQVASWR